MTTHRHVSAPHFRRFGRRPLPAIAIPIERAEATISDELRLFAMTFAGGFLFMAVYLA